MNYNLSHDDNSRLMMASKNWRHNYKRSLKRDINIYTSSSDDSKIIINILKNMQSYKNLNTIFTEHEIKNILIKLDGILILYYALNSNGDPLGMRGALLSGDLVQLIFLQPLQNVAVKNIVVMHFFGNCQKNVKEGALLCMIWEELINQQIKVYIILKKVLVL